MGSKKHTSLVNIHYLRPRTGLVSLVSV